MNTSAKVAIGAAVGFGIGWFVGAVIAEYIHMLEDEKGHPYNIDESVDDEVEEIDEFEEYQRPTNMSKTQKQTRVMNTDYTKAFKPEDKITLRDLAKQYGVTVEEPTEPPEGETPWVDEDAEADSLDDGPIRIINVAEFANSDSGYEQVTLYYYDDDVVTDEKKKIVPDPEKFIGEEALVSFGVLSDQEDVVYIRNDDRKTEYEVYRKDEPFLTTSERRMRRGAIGEENEGEEES